MDDQTPTAGGTDERQQVQAHRIGEGGKTLGQFGRIVLVEGHTADSGTAHRCLLGRWAWSLHRSRHDFLRLLY